MVERRERPVQLHPDYPQLPLTVAQAYKYGAPINLEYPGVQLVHVSPSGSPLFLVNDFLNSTECDMLVDKVSGERQTSVPYLQNRPEIDEQTVRTSTHVRVTKAETVGFHNRVAALTHRTVANMESARHGG